MNRNKGVTGPQGFRAAGIAAGIKESGALDLPARRERRAFRLAPRVPANEVKAAPVLWSQQVVQSRAPAARGRAQLRRRQHVHRPRELQDTHATAEKVAEVLGTGAVDVAVCSTGLIGERLPMDKILTGVENITKELDPQVRPASTPPPAS